MYIVFFLTINYIGGNVMGLYDFMFGYLLASSTNNSGNTKEESRSFQIECTDLPLITRILQYHDYEIRSLTVCEVEAVKKLFNGRRSYIAVNIKDDICVISEVAKSRGLFCNPEPQIFILMKDIHKLDMEFHADEYEDIEEELD